MSTKTDPHWDLSHLQLFAQIVAEGSLTRVAALVGSPQPAVSRRLARFEAECGGKLFLRTGRGLQLSDLGQRILPRAQAVLREAENLSRDIVSGAAEPAGEVRLGLLPSLCDVLLVPLFDELRLRFPGVVLRMQEGSAGHVEQWLSSGAVDLGVTLRYGSRKSSEFELLCDVEAYLTGAPDSLLTRNPQVPFKALGGAPLILPSAPSSTRLLLEQLARKHEVVLNVVAEADSTQIQQALASCGKAYAIASGHSVAGIPANRPMRTSLIVEPQIQRQLVLGRTPARPASRAAREVGSLIRRVIDKHMPRAV
ncbi:LysR family transcriptional regulator [Xylophilus rhododendri]|uniref:LysR family transcriptional regulator n=1 Tax=Xylophilus rhododendri TaxID=2697032 RepID=A0A857JBI4_9BURK|nr:LysR family transcriptional regulator [Xylophilus rhododendri]QHJ00522.1 LysR family transcriptional regulator [Xylophilus rhododendri]